MNPSEEAAPQESGFPVIHVGEIPEESPRRWLIEGLWGASAVGLLGGAPKVCKTFLALDMAVSVASDTACLGKYRVLEPGRVLIYLAEDSPQAVRERIEALARHRRLGLAQLDLYAISAANLRLDSLAHRARLALTLEDLKPRFLVLDPLVRLHGRNENDATEIAEILSYLRYLQREFSLAVMLVHHARKSGAPDGQAGQSLRGSGDLWAWSDSNLYLRRSSQNLILSMEHRAAPAPDPVALQLVDTGEGTVHLEVVAGYTEGQNSEKAPLREAILQALSQKKTMTRSELREMLGVKNERLGQILGCLEAEGRVERGPQGCRLRQL
jgi:hypothetical protein